MKTDKSGGKCTDQAYSTEKLNMDGYTFVNAAADDGSTKTECTGEFEVIPEVVPVNDEKGWIVHGQPKARSSCPCGSGKKYKRCCATPDLKNSWKKHSRSRSKPRMVSGEDVARIDKMLGQFGSYAQSTRLYVSASRKLSGRVQVRYINAAAPVAASNARSRNDIEKCAVVGWIKVKSQNLWFSVNCRRCGQYDTATSSPTVDGKTCRACRNLMACSRF